MFPPDALSSGLYAQSIIIYTPCIIVAFWVIEISSFYETYTYQELVWPWRCVWWYDIVLLSCSVSNVYFNCIVQDSLYQNTDIGTMWHCALVSWVYVITDKFVTGTISVLCTGPLSINSYGHFTRLYGHGIVWVIKIVQGLWLGVSEALPIQDTRLLQSPNLDHWYIICPLLRNQITIWGVWNTLVTHLAIKTHILCKNLLKCSKWIIQNPH